MSANLPLTILIFSVALVLTVGALVYLFVRKYPRSSVFWKRSDYVYFVSAIAAATLAFINQASSDLQGETVQLKIERNNLVSRIANSLLLFQDICRRSAEERLDWLGGVIRPESPGDFPRYAPPAEIECRHVEDAAIASGMMTDDVLDWTGRCAPYEFPPTSEEFSLYNYQLAGPSELLGRTCSEIARRSERLKYVQWLDPLRGMWPAFLGFAFGVRLTRVHAEVKAELSKDGRVSKPTLTALIAKRIAMLYSQIRNRLRSIFKPR